MRRPSSLRLRLFALILIPLVLMAILLGYWRIVVAQRTAEQLFDRSLLAAALAISRDAAVSGGDLLQPLARDLIHDASGGEVFYHATGPGGIYVTGYAYPPSPTSVPDDPYAPVFAFATYREEDVRVLRITERITIENLTGDTTVTVWQRLADRNAFANQLAIRAAGGLGALLVTLALVVWFGVARGLRPLIDLQQAISIRSPGDLSQIKRPVPVEVQGIVSTLNRLFGQVETSINAHQAFISDAAHQLRNPAAAVQSMAEAVRDAPTPDERNRRIGELVTAARGSARVTNQLLSLERLQHGPSLSGIERIDLGTLVQESCADMGPFVLSRGVDFELDLPTAPVIVSGNSVFLTEAVKNLIDNALQHGGDALKHVKVAISATENWANITVSDDGKGLSPEKHDLAFGRFSQVGASEGSGLGLAIVASVAEQHHGKVEIDAVEHGASLTLSLPL
ncbi:MAG: sensor histidine kinase [Pelagimonas sp.]|uniref:sensor histidine kinase n=1 Tax=Pelagimonas sp. TaxID=2073170 RepID=UPI003D6A1624